MTDDTIKSKLAEHEAENAALVTMQQKLISDLNTVNAQIERRSGAILALRDLLPPEVPGMLQITAPPPTD